MKTVAELEADNERLRRVIEWAEEYAMVDTTFKNWRLFCDELRARAFPPQFEEVEVKEWKIKALPGVTPNACTKSTYDVKQDWVPEGHVQIEMTGHYKRPIPTKVKRREELEVSCCDVDTITLQRGNIAKPLHCRYFAEFEE